MARVGRVRPPGGLARLAHRGGAGCRGQAEKEARARLRAQAEAKEAAAQGQVAEVQAEIQDLRARVLEAEALQGSLLADVREQESTVAASAALQEVAQRDAEAIRLAARASVEAVEQERKEALERG